MDENEKLISNRHEYIIDLFHHVLDITITDSSFRAFQGDEAIFFKHVAKDFYICYDDWKDQYQLYHLNIKNNNSRGNHYHLQRYDYTLGSLFSYLKTLHNPKDMNKKQSKIEELLFNKSNHIKGKPLD